MEKEKGILNLHKYALIGVREEGVPVGEHKMSFAEQVLTVACTCTSTCLGSREVVRRQFTCRSRLEWQAGWWTSLLGAPTAKAPSPNWETIFPSIHDLTLMCASIIVSKNLLHFAEQSNSPSPELTQRSLGPQRVWLVPHHNFEKFQPELSFWWTRIRHF